MEKLHWCLYYTLDISPRSKCSYRVLRTPNGAADQNAALNMSVTVTECSPLKFSKVNKQNITCNAKRKQSQAERAVKQEIGKRAFPSAVIYIWRCSSVQGPLHPLHMKASGEEGCSRTR